MKLTNEIDNTNSLFHKLVQIGIVVKDLDRTIKFLEQTMGWKPVSFADTPPGEKYYYGKNEDFSVKMAFYKLEHIELELLMPTRGRNVWQDWLEIHGEGLHHILFDVNDFEQAKKVMEKNGIVLAQQGPSARYKGAKWAYFDATKELGYFIEIFNPSELHYDI